MTTLTAQLRVLIQENKQPVPRAKVQLYYPLIRSDNSLLGEAKTDRGGRASIRFDEAVFGRSISHLSSPRGAIRLNTQPELVAKVYNARGSRVFEKKVRAEVGRHGLRVLVEIPYQEALIGRLIATKPSQSVANKKADLYNSWLKKLRSDDPRPPEDLCLANMILNTVRNIENPQNSLQKKAAKALKNKLPSTTLGKVAQQAGKAQDFLKESAEDWKNNHGISEMSHLLGGGCSSEDDLKDLVTKWLKPGGRFGQITKALNAGDPPPNSILEPESPGRPFSRPFTEWQKDCKEKYEQGSSLPSAQGQADMDQYYPDQLTLISMPRVNKIDVWDDVFSKYIRVGHPATKLLEITTLDGENGWVDGQIDMNVPLDDEGCIVLKEDFPTTGIQILAADVQPGQQVLLRGSGFIADKARVSTSRYAWIGGNDGADDDGRLVPAANDLSVAQLDGIELNVHGAQTHAADDTAETFIGDAVEFHWPDDVTEPGLYSMRLDFGVVPAGMVVSASQDENTCEVNVRVPNNLRSQIIWFAILPALKNRDVSFHAERLTCDDEKDPEIWPLFDDVVFTTLGSVHKLNIDTTTPENSTLELEQETTESGGNWFFGDGDEWLLPNFRLAPEGSATSVDMEQNRIVVFAASANEILGTVESVIIAGIVVAIIVVAMILIAVIIAIVVSIIIGLILLGPVGASIGPTLGIIGVVLAAIGAVTAAILAPIVTGVFTSVMFALAATPNADALSLVVSGYSGAECSHRFAANRWQRRLWTHPRPPQPPGLLQTTSQLTASSDTLIESFTSTNDDIGSTYTLEVRSSLGT